MLQFLPVFLHRLHSFKINQKTKKQTNLLNEIHQIFTNATVQAPLNMLRELHRNEKHKTIKLTYFFCPLCLRGTEFCLGVFSQAPSVLSLASLLFKGWFFHGITYPGVGLNCFKSPCPNELRSPQ